MNVLIDDDKMIHLGWELKADKAKVSLKCFCSVEEFLQNKDEIDLDSSIFIDSDLKQSEKGEIQAKKLYDLGFKNLYLVTGYTDLKLEDYPWLKGIKSKTAAF